MVAVFFCLVYVKNKAPTSYFFSHHLQKATTTKMYVNSNSIIHDAGSDDIDEKKSFLRFTSRMHFSLEAINGDITHLHTPHRIVDIATGSKVK